MQNKPMNHRYQEPIRSALGDTRFASREVTISNEFGIHMRPAAKMVHLVHCFRSSIHLVVDGEEYFAGQIMDLLRAHLTKGTRLTLVAEGTDAEIAISALVKFLDSLALEETETEASTLNHKTKKAA